MKKRITSLLLVLAMCFAMLPTAAFAAEADFNVANAGGPLTPTTGSGVNAQVYKITDDGVDIDVSGTTSYSRIVVTGDGVTLHLNNASMILNERNGSPIEIAENKSVTIIFAGENKLTADAGGPGILVNQGATLTIKEADNTSANSLTVTGAQQDNYMGGDDIIASSGGGFAGIGGPNSSSQLTYTGTIKIESGIVNAYGFGYGAGIGGGDYSSGGTIQISGGTVTAINGGTEPDGWGSSMHKQASGIGGSQGMDSGLITIFGNADVKAYGGYACAGIGGGKNDITITDNAKVTAYGGENAAGIGGYNQDKGESTITISGSANVTAYGGKYASGLGQGSASAPVVKLTIGSDAVITAYSDGRKAAITGTPQEGSASIINMYANDINLGTQNVSLTLTADDSNTQNITLAGGYKGIGTTCAAGNYTVTAPAEQEGSSYRLIPADGKSFKVAAASDNSAYQGTKLMLMLVSGNGTTIQLNPTSGTTIQSGNDEPLVLDEENGVIIVPAGGSVNDTVWLAGGTVAKNGTQKVNVESIALNENTLTLYTNRDPKTAALTATVSPDNATDKTVAWTSADEKVATVENGVVTAVGNGTTTITAQAGGKTAVCTVTVSTRSSSSGGSSKTTYPVNTPTADNGTAAVSPKNAAKGDTVTITVTPDNGYKVDKVTVTNANGNTITVTDKGNGKYTFTMPASKVTVTPTFVKIAQQPTGKTFSDVAKSDWFADAVAYVTDKGLMNGTGSDTFSPNASTTRGMLMTVLARYAGADTTGGATWYEKGMNWAKAKGVSDGTNPNADITREQLVTMLYRSGCKRFAG